LAHIVGIAFIKVVTRAYVWRLNATIHWVAEIICTYISVVTGQGEARCAVFVGTNITDCAYVSVVARRCVGIVAASLCGRAVIVSAWVFIVTLETTVRNADASLALFVGRAWIQVIAIRSIVFM